MVGLSNNPWKYSGKNRNAQVPTIMLKYYPLVLIIFTWVNFSSLLKPNFDPYKSRFQISVAVLSLITNDQYHSLKNQSLLETLLEILMRLSLLLVNHCTFSFFHIRSKVLKKEHSALASLLTQTKQQLFHGDTTQGGPHWLGDRSSWRG